MAETAPTRSSNWRHILIILGIALLLIMLEIAAQFPNATTPLELVELSVGDTIFRVRGEAPINENIVIVAIDDDSLGWVGERWPWSRTRFAEIVDWLDEAGAKVIALDIFLFDPSDDPEDDLILAESIKNARSVVSVSQMYTEQDNNIIKITNDIPEDIFIEVLDGFGITEIERDDDAIVRGIKAYKVFQGEVYYNWAFKIVEAYLDIDPPTNYSPASLTFNGQEIPLNQRGKFLINFAGPAETYPTYSAAFVPKGDYPPELFKDKIVFIGASSETLQDIYPTPFSATTLTPGVEVIANAVATLLSGEYFQIAPVWVTLVLILLAAVLSWLIIKIPRPTLSIGLVILGMLGYFVLRTVVFYQTGWQVAIVSPTLMLFLGVVIPSLEQAVAQEAEKRRVRSMFSRFISPEMVTQLLETQDISSLNKRTELTILFSDIRGFTSLSEKMAPEEVVGLLNPYLAVMSKVIHTNGGTVDKYEGDAIVAFFGEPIPHPDHAIRAARAALEMRDALKSLTQRWLADGKYSEPFEMGIGLHTGEVFVGLLGSEQRINYTVIGDTANQAARLQDQTKEYGYPILISEETYELVKHIYQAEFVDSRVLKGKSEPVNIYRLVGPIEEKVRTVI